MYQNLVNTLSMMDNSEGTSDRVIRGLILSHDSSMTCTLSSGAAISYTGTYLTVDTWGFSPSAGDLFVVAVPEDTQIAFTDGVGQSDPRIDTLQIRPVRVNIDTLTRSFKDPITGVVSTALVPTGFNYVFEFAVSEGTPAPTPTAPATTAGWVKLAEVTVPAGASAITDANIVTYELSETWTAGAGSTVYISRTFRELNGDMTLSGNNTHTGDNNFTGTLQKDGSDVVTTSSGTQTITGDKNFTGDNDFTGNNNFTGDLQKDGSDVVTLASDQTITGVKTFSTQIRVPTNTPTSLGDGAIWVAP